LIKKIVLIVIFICFQITNLKAQSKTVFEKLRSDNGITQSIVYAIAQDNYGNIWLATEEGVIRNDSRDSYVYNKSNGINDVISNRVLSIFIDSKKRIWIGTLSGIYLYNAQKDAFFPVTKNRTNTPIGTTTITEDKNGTIWFAANNGIWKCSSINGKYIQNNIISNTVVSICTFNSSLVYGYENSLYLLNTLNNKTTKIKSFESKSTVITSVRKTQEHIFIGTSNGQLIKTSENLSDFETIFSNPKFKDFTLKDVIFYNNYYFLAFDGGGIVVLNNKFQMVKHYFHNDDDAESISSDGVYDLFVDNQNILWIATYGGEVNYINTVKKNFTIIKHESKNSNSLSTSFCRSFLDVGNNTIWFGTRNGINIWNRNSNTWKHIKNIGNSSTGEIILSLADDGKFVWAGTYYSGLFKINKQTLEAIQYSDNEPKDRYIPLKKVFKVYKDRQNNIWAGGINGNLSQIKPNGEIKVYGIKQIRDITQDKNGDIIAVGKDGVYKVSKKGAVSEIKNLKASKGRVEYVTINCVVETTDNKLLLGTNGAGIIQYNPKSNKINIINSESNLPSDIVQGIIEYNPKEYWVSTTKGLAKLTFSGTKNTIIKYEQIDGLSSTEFNYNAYAKLNSGELIFGGLDGVTLFNPKSIVTQKHLPKIVIEEFSVFNEEIKSGSDILESSINETQVLNLKYSQNSIGLKFIGVLHGYSSKVKYSWKLEGFDKDWTKPSEKTRGNYTNLSYGEYVFRVKATNSDGIWGPEKTITINIARPWWASYFAFFIYVVLLVGIIYGVIYIATLWESKRSKEEQINTLNNITHEIKTPLSILIASLENEETMANKTEINATINRLNSLIKQMLNFHLVTSENDAPKEISKIKINEYISDVINNFKPLLNEKKLKIIVNNNFRSEIFYFEKEDLDKIVFNLISNAIKYSKDKGKITVDLSNNKKKQLVVTITDNGIGIPKDQQKYILNNFYRARNAVNSKYSGTGLGLMIAKNLVERNNGKITFKSNENVGTTFKFSLSDQESSYIAINIKQEEKKNLTFDVSELYKFHNNKILIVEDNEFLRKNMVGLLENYFLVYEAENGKEGLETALQIFPNLIITDYMLPIMDGVEMCNAIKDDINLNHIPVFMMTALHSGIHKQKSIESGITEYFEKPIDINILLAKINNIFSWQDKLKEKYLHQGDIDNAEKFKSKKDSDFIENLEQIILDKIKDENFTLLDICNIIGMSRTSLYMKLKSLIDLSPQDFIILTKLKYSKKLLVESDGNIKEVAYNAGFSNPKYFSTSFKKQFGQTPSEFLSSLEKE
jgi:CheY-like chemotaxis protein/ligand-binding sensor domain-containing protein/AraC-like DNA-binding protein/two-component sensor histidine kinase